MKLLADQGVDDICVVGGGVIQEDDIPKLKAIGVREVFNAEASTQDLIDGIERIVGEYGRASTRAAKAATAAAAPDR
jgi:methylmalonyl-CoA mutase C-terminal domain/subunit